MRSPRFFLETAATLTILVSLQSVAAAQVESGECQPYSLKGTVLECSATGSLLAQLRTATFIAGSQATGETLARAITLEVATAPIGSSSGGFTYVWDPSTLTISRRTGTFGPSFSERALTIGRRKLSAGFNILNRSYDRLGSLNLDGFDVFRFQGGTLPVSSSRFQLQTRTGTFVGFANYGLSDNLDVGLLVPYVHISIDGVSSIYGQPTDELQRVLIHASAAGFGDIALSSKYRFWTLRPKSATAEELQGGLAAGVILRLPSGNTDNLIGLGATRALVSVIGSTVLGHLSPHVNLGYEVWSHGVAIPKDFQGESTISAKDQAQYSAGFEFEMNRDLSLMIDVLGRHLRGAGGVGYQPFVFPQNFAGVAGAEVLVAVPSGISTALLVPGAKWNVYKGALLTANVLVPLTDKGLRTRVAPVIGIDWGF